MIFSNIKVGNFFWHNCLTWEDAPVYKIWAHYLNKWHGYGLALGHLDWKPWMFIHDRPFCEASFLKSCQNSSLSFFMASSTHKRTARKFFEFLLFSFTFFKTGSNLSAWPFVERSWINLNSHRFYYKMTTLVP